MKKLLLFLTLTFALFTFSRAQEYANFTLTGEHQGTGVFTNAVLSNFTWQATGTLAQEVQILNNEVFDDGNEFEDTFGQADNSENLRIQIYPNGEGTAGEPALHRGQQGSWSTPAGMCRIRHPEALVKSYVRALRKRFALARRVMLVGESLLLPKLENHGSPLVWRFAQSPPPQHFDRCLQTTRHHASWRTGSP